MASDRPRRIGRYEIRDRIGQGGMGVLWRAWDPRLERLVAIKQLWTHSDDVRRRFLREASVAAKLQHPHIVTIYDTNEHDGQPFIAMEFIAGKTLAELIKTRTVGTVANRLQLMIDLCDGLAFAHRAGVVHRDIKPANLMLNEEGELKILDFGIARVMDASLTQDGTTLGTPNYMSPEQVQGHHVDHRSDIFAVGLVLYELLSYRQAFPGESHHMVALKILDDEPEPLLHLMPGLDPVLDDIVEKCLRKQPDDRYQDLLEVRRDLVAVRDEIEQASTEDTVAGLPGSLAPQRPAPTPPGRFDAGALRRRRQEQIDHHLAAAERALADSRLEEAQEAVEAAATLDPDHARVVATHERVRAAMGRREAAALAARARASVASGALSDALGRLADAERVHPAPGELAELRREIVGKVEAREREQARLRALDAALDRARASQAAGDLDAAVAAADEALGHGAADPRAIGLRQALEQLLVERRRLDAEARLVAECVASCDKALAQGDVDAASGALDACGVVQHPDVAAARERISERVALLARKRREQELREREAERQRLARERWVAGQYVLARAALASGDPDAALVAIDALTAVEGGAPDVAALRDEAIALRNDKLQREQVAQLVVDAEEALSRGEPDRAVAILGQARQIAPDEAGLEERYGAARHAAAEANARRKAEAHDRAASDAVRLAGLEFERDQRAAALERLRRFAPAHAVVTAELVRLSDEAARLDRLAREEVERQRQQSLDESARAAVAAADAAFDADEAGALQRLRARAPRHPLVDEAIERLAAAAVVRQRERAEADERRQAALLADRARNAVESARREFGAGRRGPALDLLRSFAPPHPETAAALQELEAEASRLRALEDAAAERARVDREARERAEREAAAAIAESRALFDAGRRDDALARLRGFPGDPALVAPTLRELTDLGTRLAREEAEGAAIARRRRLESGAAHLKAGDLEAAEADAAWVLAQSPDSKEANDLRARIADAVAGRERRARAIEEAESAMAEAERTFAAGRCDEAVDRLRQFGGDAQLVAGVLGELTEAAGWRSVRADRLERARAGEAAGHWAEAADALRSILDGDRQTSRPPADVAAIGNDLRRVVRAGWHVRLGDAAAMVSRARWDDADAALRALDAELSASPGGVIGDPVDERREARALLATVAAALAERERAERQRLEDERERERRARARRDLFDAVRRDFEAGLGAQGMRRLEDAAHGDAIVTAACARLASGQSLAGRARAFTPASTTGEPGAAVQRPQTTARLREIEACLARAESLVREGRRARASAYVAAALAIDPDHADARAWSAWLRTPVSQAPAWNIRRSLWLLWDDAWLAVHRPGRARAS